MPATDVTLMMRPERCRSIGRSAALQHKKAPVTTATLPASESIDRLHVSHIVRQRAWRTALQQTGQHLAGADLDKAGHAGRQHRANRIVPAHRRRDLLS